MIIKNIYFHQKKINEELKNIKNYITYCFK